MKIKRTPMFYVVIVIFLLMLIEVGYYVNLMRKTEPIIQVSLIVYGSDNRRWDNLKQGADTAAADMNAEVTLITMSSDDDPEEQTALIRREALNGADALLIAACDAKAIGSYIKNNPPGIPYAFVESGTGDPDVPVTGADDAEMAQALAGTIDDNEKDWIKAAVICDHIQRDSVRKRLDALLNTDIHYADDVVIWERDEQEIDKKAQFFLQRKLTEEAVDVIIALDSGSVEELMDATLNLNKDIKIYGIANSSKSVYYVDNRLIKSLIYQDEFSMGYIGLKRLLSEREGDREEADKYAAYPIAYGVVDHQNMYDESNQRLLFPTAR
ncbi:MAG: substrate-binding domain-containing protein [Lachnospiraceae bacterium]|nr:substrate-binding domain-containing protein [Lachnospiraceae bacterium]